MSDLTYPGILTGTDYLKRNRDAVQWLVQPLIPFGGSAVLYGPAKLGKALALDTPLLTPDGWKTIAHIQPGDSVYGSDGTPVGVLAVSPVMHNRRCYTVTLDDGVSITVDAAHEWTVFNIDRQIPVTLTTQAILDLGVSGGSGRYPRYHWRIALTAPIDFGNTGDLPIDPYCLGSWLGDGTQSNSQFTSADPEIIQVWVDNGWTVTKQPSNAYGYGIKGLAEELSALGVLNNKHIPDIYLQSSISNRKELLAGLLDTDGWSNKGRAEFYNTNKRLAYQVYDLAVQLGCKVKITNKVAKLYGKGCGLVYTVAIRAGFNPFRLTRKAVKFEVNRESYRTIVRIEPTNTVPVKCLVVEAPDHLFLVGRNCVPTHNSFLAVQLGLAMTGAIPDFLGFPVTYAGRVVYIQVDTPGGTWTNRLNSIKRKTGLPVEQLYYGDRSTLAFYPMDVTDPKQIAYFRSIIAKIQPTVVIFDAMRDIHSMDEDSSTNMRNVVVNLRSIVGDDAAFVLVAHERKPSKDQNPSLLGDMRGSGAIVAAVDAIMRLTKHRLYYTSREIEEGSIQLARDRDSGIWVLDEDPNIVHLNNIMRQSFDSERARARALASLASIKEDTAMSMIRRERAQNGSPKSR